jgi:receptor-type tyrosine-protein phosphatase N
MVNVQNCGILIYHHHKPIELFLCLQSYMEDHLKNKDRLEQEWVALCAYEAEPCATTVAQKVSQTHI